MEGKQREPGIPAFPTRRANIRAQAQVSRPKVSVSAAAGRWEPASRAMEKERKFRKAYAAELPRSFG
jgi:hypothetical protein